MTPPNDPLPPLYRTLREAAQRVVEAFDRAACDPALLADLRWSHDMLHATTDMVYEIGRMRRPNWRGETYDR